MRIEGDPLTLRYNDGGIVFMEDAEGTVSGVRVDDGVNFQFNPHASTLSVNGSPIHISGAELLKESNGTRWYKLTRSTTTDVIYLVVDL